MTTDSESARTPKIRIQWNLKITGSAYLSPDTGELDWHTTRLHGSATPTIDGEQVIGAKKELRKRADDQFVARMANYFFNLTNLEVPKPRSKAYINQWRSPILGIYRQSWVASGVNPSGKWEQGDKWGVVSQLAVAFLVRDSVAKLKSDNMPISSPITLVKTAKNLTREIDYPQLARTYLQEQGRANEIDA